MKIFGVRVDEVRRAGFGYKNAETIRHLAGRLLFFVIFAKIYNRMEYTIQIKQNPQSGWFIGQCEEIPEAITQGKDMDQLMLMMQDAIELALECRRDEFRQQYSDENAFVQKLILGYEKKFVHQAPERRELCAV